MTRDFSHGGHRTVRVIITLSRPTHTHREHLTQRFAIATTKASKGIYIYFFSQLRQSRVKSQTHTVFLSRSSVRRHDHPRHPLLPRQHSGCPRHVHHRRIPLHRRECQIRHSCFMTHGQRGSFVVEPKRTSSIILCVVGRAMIHPIDRFRVTRLLFSVVLHTFFRPLYLHFSKCMGLKDPKGNSRNANANSPFVFLECRVEFVCLVSVFLPPCGNASVAQC